MLARGDADPGKVRAQLDLPASLAGFAGLAFEVLATLAGLTGLVGLALSAFAAVAAAAGAAIMLRAAKEAMRLRFICALHGSHD